MPKDKYNLEKFYHMYKHLVFFVCFKYLKNKEQSLDATSEIFKELIEHPEKLDDVYNVKSWLLTFAKNKCLKLLRKQKSERLNFDKYSRHQRSSIQHESHFNLVFLQEQEADNEQLLNDLYEALTELKENHRTCLSLYYFQQKSYKEVIEITSFSFRQVDNFLYYGKRKLRRILQKRGWTKDEFNQVFKTHLT